MALTVYINTGSVDDAVGETGVEFTEMSTANDYLVFSAGSDVVKDGEPIPSDSELTQAGVVIDTVDVEVDKFFLADISANELKEISLAGNQNKRYVFAFSFDSATASEPVLEMWDDSDLDSYDNHSLGEGVASSSWFRGITTTDGLPGASWTGSRIAGSSDGHFLWLNNENGALSGAKVLYCNLRCTVPANYDTAGAETPIIVIKFTTT